MDASRVEKFYVRHVTCGMVFVYLKMRWWVQILARARFERF